MEGVDGGKLGLLVSVAAVVAYVVVAFLHANGWVRTVGAFVGKHESDHAGLVSLQGQHSKVCQQAQVLLVVLGHTRWRLDAHRLLWVGSGTFRKLNAALHRAHTFQVFVQLAAVLCGQALVQLGQRSLHGVQQALAQRHAAAVCFGALAFWAVAEQAFEHAPRVMLLAVG